MGTLPRGTPISMSDLCGGPTSRDWLRRHNVNRRKRPQPSVRGEGKSAASAGTAAVGDLLEKEKAQPADDILIDPRAAHAAPSGYGN